MVFKPVSYTHLDVYKRQPLVLAAAMGGNLTLIGAPGNLIAQSALEDLSLKFSFFDFAKIGLPMLACGVLYFSVFGHKLLPDRCV